MLNVVLDTSSFLAFCGSQRFNFPVEKFSGFYRVQPGFENTLEAIILYDLVHLDGPSIRRNDYAIETFEGLKDVVKLIELSPKDEGNCYSSILELTNHIDANPNITDLFRGHTQTWMTDECGAGHTYPSSSWSDVERVLPENLLQIAQELKISFGSYLPFSGAACLALIRTFYYQGLQKQLGYNLLLDPWKGYFYENASYGSSIVNMFDKTVRDNFIQRKRKWLSNQEVNIKIPMLSQYILNKIKSWDELLPICLDLRQSNLAIAFREGITHLVDAIEKNDNIMVDEILSSLEWAQVSWSKNLSSTIQPKEKVTFTVPIINLGTEFNIKDPLLTKKPADKILIFIHELLRGS